MGKQGRERKEHSFTEKSEEGISFNKRTPLKTKYQIPPLEFISIYFFLIFQDKISLCNWWHAPPPPPPGSIYYFLKVF